jgi:hypothetical protein
MGVSSGSYSMYAYVGDNPSSNEDPTGMMRTAGVGCWTTPAEARLECGKEITMTITS